MNLHGFLSDAGVKDMIDYLLTDLGHIESIGICILLRSSQESWVRSMNGPHRIEEERVAVTRLLVVELIVLMNSTTNKITILITQALRLRSSITRRPIHSHLHQWTRGTASLHSIKNNDACDNNPTSNNRPPWSLLPFIYERWPADGSWASQSYSVQPLHLARHRRQVARVVS